jgi:hypothetical protein
MTLDHLFSTSSIQIRPDKTAMHPQPIAVLLILSSQLLSAQNPSHRVPPQPSDPNPATPANLSDHQVYDPLLDLPPLPRARVSLIGGTVTRLDHVQDQLTVQPFGGKQQMRFAFDVRTRFYRDNQVASEREIKPGQRIHVDSMLDGSRMFAKSIWIETGTPNGNGRGQVLAYDRQNGILTVRDELSSQSLKFRVDKNMQIRQGSETRSISELREGSLVSLVFGPEQEQYGTVQQISLLAQPGSQYSFFGRVTYLDLSQKMIAVENQSDNQTYEIHLQNLPGGSIRGLRQGSMVDISAVFDGTRYVVQTIELAPAPQAPVR